MMEHLFLLCDVYHLLNAWDFDTMPTSTRQKLAAMRERVSDYVDSQGYEIGYIGPEQVALLRDGVVVSEAEVK